MTRFESIRRHGAGLALAAALLLAGCADDPAPPFEIEGTGALEGFVFLDANEDGFYDPSDGDMPVEGVRVVAFNRGTTEVIPGATATTDADGRFQITGLPAGTHDFLFDETTIPEGVSICRNPIPATVVLNETEFEEVVARPGCLIAIAEAKPQPLESFVIVRGIVTSAPGQIETSFAYIEDETAGLFLFAPALMGQGIEVGDLIEVGGTTDVFNGQFQIANVVLREHIEDAAIPQPELVTTAEIAASGSDPLHPLQNRFVRVEKAQLVAEFGAGGTNEQNAVIDDGSGAVQIRVDDAVADRGQLNTLFTAGACYNINGFAANFRGTAQIFPRSMADVEEVPCN